MDARGSFDRDGASISRVDRVERGPQKINQTRAPLRLVITVRFAATWQHRTRRSRGTRIIKTHQRTCLIERIITAEIKSCGTHLDRQIKIEGAKLKAFYNVSLTITSGPSIMIEWLRYFCNGPRWTVPL